MARYRLELGPVPLHHQVYLDLKAAIDGGEWRPGDRVPPERELARRYGCSLITVRRALDELSREGRLERHAGRGTFVLPPPHRSRHRAPLSRSPRRCSAAASIPRPGCVAARPEAAGETVAAALELEPAPRPCTSSACASPTASRCCSRWSTCPRSASRACSPATSSTTPCTTLLTERYGTPVVRAREALEPVLLPAREASLLGSNRGASRCSSRASRSPATARPVEFGRTYVRGDRTRYYVERVVSAPSSAGPGDAGERSPADQASGRARALETRDDVLGLLRRSTCDAIGACAALARAGDRVAPAARRADDRPPAAGDRRSPLPASAARRDRDPLVLLPRHAASDPAQVAGREAGRRGVRADAPGQQPQVRGRHRTTRRATRCRPRSRRQPARTSSARSASAAPNAFQGQWLDLRRTSTKTGLRPDPVPDPTRSTSTSATRARSACRSPSTLRALVQEEPVRRGRPRRAAAQVRRQVHDAGRHRRSTGTTTRCKQIAMLLTVDKNGKDATQAGFDPDNIVQWGFEPQRDDLRGWAPTAAPASLVGGDGKTAQIPDAWEAAWQFFYDGMWKDHFIMTGPHVHEPGHQPRGLPVLHRQGRDERRTSCGPPTASTGAGKDWDMAAIPSYNGTHDRRLQRGHVPRSSRTARTPTRRSRS